MKNENVRKKTVKPDKKRSNFNMRGRDLKTHPKITERLFKKQPFLYGLKSGLLQSQGATLIEIALYIALVVIVCIAVVASLGDKLQGVFSTIVDSL